METQQIKMDSQAIKMDSLQIKMDARIGENGTGDLKWISKH